MTPPTSLSLDSNFFALVPFLHCQMIPFSNPRACTDLIPYYCLSVPKRTNKWHHCAFGAASQALVCQSRSRIDRLRAALHAGLLSPERGEQVRLRRPGGAQIKEQVRWGGREESPSLPLHHHHHSLHLHHHYHSLPLHHQHHSLPVWVETS